MAVLAGGAVRRPSRFRYWRQWGHGLSLRHALADLPARLHRGARSCSRSISRSPTTTCSLIPFSSGSRNYQKAFQDPVFLPRAPQCRDVHDRRRALADVHRPGDGGRCSTRSCRSGGSSGSRGICRASRRASSRRSSSCGCSCPTASLTRRSTSWESRSVSTGSATRRPRCLRSCS